MRPSRLWSQRVLKSNGREGFIYINTQGHVKNIDQWKLLENWKQIAWEEKTQKDWVLIDTESTDNNNPVDNLMCMVHF